MGIASMVKALKVQSKTTIHKRQNFVSIVSVFASKRGLVLGMEKFDNKKESEIVIVQNLITTLDIKGAVFSFDSLHCQKKLAS